MSILNITTKLRPFIFIFVPAVIVNCGGDSLSRFLKDDSKKRPVVALQPQNGDVEVGAAIDIDGDGIPDGVGIDTDGDGIVDMIDTNGDNSGDTDYNSSTHTAYQLPPIGSGYDLDGDGKPDGVVVDANGDGIPDGLDTDGDGIADHDLAGNAFPFEGLYTIGGRIVGLQSDTLLLSLNNGDDLYWIQETTGVSLDTAFFFTQKFSSGYAYSVTVATQPDSQFCSVNGGTGTLSNFSIDDVSIVCADDEFDISVNVSGISGSLSISNNGSDFLTVDTDGTYTFTVPVADGATYSVTLDSLPAGQSCSISTGTGTVDGSGVDNIGILCSSLAVEYYYSNARNWNDYVKNDGSDIYTSGDIACDGSETGGYNACIHGGEMRSVSATGYSDCSGLTATDYLGAFDWVCRDDQNPVRFVSRLKTTKNLSDLMDFVGYDWSDNYVTVFDSGALVLQTAPSNWYPDNPVTQITDAGPYVLTTVSGIYISGDSLTFAGNESLDIQADRIAVTFKPGASLTTGGRNVFTADGTPHRFLWIEGSYIQTATSHALTLDDTSFSMIRAFEFLSGQHALQLDGSHNNRIEKFFVFTANVDGMALDDSDYNTFDGVTVNDAGNVMMHFYNGSDNNTVTNFNGDGNGNEAFLLNNSHNNTISGAVLTNVGGDAIEIDGGATSNDFSDITISTAGGRAIYVLNSSHQNTFTDITASNLTNQGIAFESSDEIELDTISVSDTDFDGIYALNSTQHDWQNIFVSQTGQDGIQLENVDSSTFDNVNIDDTGNHGILIVTDSNDNSLTNLNINTTAFDGISCLSSIRNNFRDLHIADSSQSGLSLQTCNLNRFYNLSIFNSTLQGIFFNSTASNQSNNAFINVLIAGTDGPGLYMIGPAHNSHFINITLANNANEGLFLNGHSTQGRPASNVFMNVATINHSDGIRFDTGGSPPTNNQFYNIASAHNTGYGINAVQSEAIHYGGLFKVGNNTTNDCNYGSGSAPGFTDSNCTQGTNYTQTSSDFSTAVTGIDLAGSFEGKLGTADSTNSHGVLTLAYDSINDWNNFDSLLRGWGKSHADGFPSSNHAGRCDTEDCTLWDFNLLNGDTGDGGSPALLGVVSEPPVSLSDSDVFVQVQAAADESDCNTSFPDAYWHTSGLICNYPNYLDLTPSTGDCEAMAVGDGTVSASFCYSIGVKHAYEIFDDSIGNDNGLCESGESCIYTPNIGAYQGHGTLQDLKTVSGTVLNGHLISTIDLKVYADNGN